ncbi:cell division protein ZapA [Reyranella sp. CPCC 100927]|uniref:cell division protein ZapA n=1 Tax=Reyranella sp. CPCC 100927 TaxID=2599616 RepID=UPI0011B7B8AE|nr:cell division protein ZapA [Reyranella sp. CPCC 100927]TWT12679.1 cell division protein ZapA [Reyranella sp. CPCC 100927]
MPQITIRIGSRSYDLACGEGQEDRTHALAAEVDACLTELRIQMPNAPEAKLLVFVGLMMADRVQEAQRDAEAARAELAEARGELDADAPQKGDTIPVEELFSRLENRIETFARKVAAA